MVEEQKIEEEKIEQKPVEQKPEIEQKPDEAKPQRGIIAMYRVICSVCKKRTCYYITKTLEVPQIDAICSAKCEQEYREKMQKENWHKLDDKEVIGIIQDRPVSRVKYEKDKEITDTKSG